VGLYVLIFVGAVFMFAATGVIQDQNTREFRRRYGRGEEQERVGTFLKWLHRGFAGLIAVGALIGIVSRLL
jgi:hypothetical protein